MDPLNFLESEKLLQFFHRKKTEMSCIENPHTFLSQLRDHDLIPEDRYQMVNHMEDKENIKKALYDILDQFEREKSQHIQDFWNCIFEKIIMDQYPTLRHLRKKLMKELPGRVEKGETVKNKGEQRSRTVSGNDEPQPGPSSQLTPGPKNMSDEIHFSSPMDKGEMTDVRPLTNQLPVMCGNLEGRLNRDKLAKGGRCILVNKRWLTPPEFEKRAGRKSAKWKSSIRYNGATLKECMEKWKLIPPSYRGGCRRARKSRAPSHLAHYNKRNTDNLAACLLGNLTSGAGSGSLGGTVVHKPEGERFDSQSLLKQDTRSLLYAPTSSFWQQHRPQFPNFKFQ